MKPEQLVGDQLVVGRPLQGQELFKKTENLWRPCPMASTATDSGGIGLAVAQIHRSKLVQAGPANAQLVCGLDCAKGSRIERLHNLPYENRRKPTGQLFFS